MYGSALLLLWIIIERNTHMHEQVKETSENNTVVAEVIAVLESPYVVHYNTNNEFIATKVRYSLTTTLHLSEAYKNSNFNKVQTESQIKLSNYFLLKIIHVEKINYWRFIQLNSSIGFYLILALGSYIFL